jgi:BMFP domain-containing protein YqiC
LRPALAAACSHGLVFSAFRAHIESETKEAPMQPGSKIFDDMSKLMNNAMGVAQGAKAEASTAMKSLLDRWLADRDFVTREEFDAVKAMAQKAREENSALEARLAALESKKKA